MSLYQLHRPQKFRDLYGQDHIKITLTNSLTSGKINHGFLFSGPKGSGKTTTARLLAKALNCQNRKKGEFEPCGKCLSCLETTAGRALDVIEIDAASNRGIDEIRELRDKVRFAPSSGNYKVYIIDEVHMLTKEAFNALLKTLEEPPKHAVFVMATTEAQKVPATIISRVCHFDFRRATNKELLSFLKKITTAENILVDEEALNLIIEKSEGSYRDSLSILEQAAASLNSARQKLTLEITQKALGLPPQKIVNDLVQYLLKGESEKGLKVLHDSYENGADVTVLIEAMIDVLRRQMLENPSANLILVPVIEELNKARKEIKLAPIALLPLEMVLVSRTADEKSEIQNPKSETSSKSEIINSKHEDFKPTVSALPSSPISPETWQEILEKIKEHNHSLRSLLLTAKPIGIKDNVATLAVRFKFHKEQLYEPQKRKILETVFSEVLKMPCRVDCVVDEKLDIAAMKEDDMVKEAEEIFGET